MGNRYRHRPIKSGYAMPTINRKIPNAYKAITTERTNVRALPTSTPFYLDPRRVGEGFPSNYKQNSALHMNVPVFVSHFSKDGRWAFVRASYAFGWVKVSDIAFVDQKFIRAFRNGTYAITIKDDLRLYEGSGKEVSFVKLGTLFPVSKDGKHYLAARRDSNGKAQIEKVSVSNPKIIAKKPLPFTPENVTKVAKEFYNEPYGWGGSYGWRDYKGFPGDFRYLPETELRQTGKGRPVHPHQRYSKTGQKEKDHPRSGPFPLPALCTGAYRPLPWRVQRGTGDHAYLLGRSQKGRLKTDYGTHHHHCHRAGQRKKGYQREQQAYQYTQWSVKTHGSHPE